MKLIVWRKFFLFGLWMVIAGLPVGHAQDEPVAWAVRQQTIDGQEVLVVAFAMDQPWHIYWQNPGEIGLPTTIAWSVQDRPQTDPRPLDLAPVARWPRPEVWIEKDILSYGMQGWSYIFFPLPENFMQQQAHKFLTVKVSYLACAATCRPGQGTYTQQLDAPFKGGPWQFWPQEEDLRAAYQQAIKSSVIDSKTDIRWELKREEPKSDLYYQVRQDKIADYGLRPDDHRWGQHLPMMIPLGDGAPGLSYGREELRQDGQYIYGRVALQFHNENGLQNHNKDQGKDKSRERLPQIAAADLGTLVLGLSKLKVNLTSPVTGDLSLAFAQAQPCSWPLNKAAQEGQIAPENANAAPATAVSSPHDHFLYILLLAFLAGIFLNVMPCVLPVLSLKVLSTIKALEGQGSALAAQTTSRKAHLYYASGMMLTVLLLGPVVLILKMAGKHVVWGMQLQQPLFLVMMGILFVLMAATTLELLDWQVVIPYRWTKKLNRDFALGVITAVTATPCLTPGIGPALAYAWAAPPWAAVAIFAAMGAGLATPFFLLAFWPQLIFKLLPPPGRWMEKLKRWMAYALLAAAIWFFYLWWKAFAVAVPSRLLLVLLGLGLVVWKKIFWQKVAGIVLLVVVLLLPMPAYDPADAVKWSPEIVNQKNPVLVFVTADWCLYCKTAEIFKINTTKFKQFQEKHHLVLVKGDLTHLDAALIKWMDTYGSSSGVPAFFFKVPGHPIKFLGNDFDLKELSKELQAASAIEATSLADEEN